MLFNINIFEVLKLIIALSGGIYAIIQYNIQRKEKREKYVLDLFINLCSDKEIRDVLYYIDSGTLDGSISHGGDLEEKADKTLKYLNFIGISLKNNMIRLEEIMIYKYELIRILDCREIQNYIEWHKSIKVNVDGLLHLYGKLG